MKSSSKIYLDEAALKQNWKFLRSYFGPDIKISAVVKGNAYGHGIQEYVPLAEQCGVDHFSVYNAGEAYMVQRVSSPDTTIMIMGAMDDDDVAWAVENGIEFFVFDMQRLRTAIAAAEKTGQKAKVHIELETGMYRTGFAREMIPQVLEVLAEYKEHVRFRGLCMHFAGAENISNHVRLKQQKIIFKKTLKYIKEQGMEPEQVHTCCSAAAIRFPDMRYDMLRIGIMQYGFWPSPEIMVEFVNRHGGNKEEEHNSNGNGNGMTPLKRVIRWESHVMSVKDVPAGAFVGYGYSYFAQRPMRIAVVPVGYAHGFSRSLSNTGHVLIYGYRTPVIGIVNMNCIAVDISDVPNVQIGDEVTMIGRQGAQEISVASFGEMTNQLNYELLTRLPVHIPRYVRPIKEEATGEKA